ncbi:MAG TPA: RNA polymerase sigma factor [Pirellulales bacterium]|jgi:RNA polymerase sigma-70 factor (ECF subfamily)|nr:RNA polymerase sigma factor [Pirellulales bacterium]
METAARRARDEWLALRCQLGEAAAFDELVQELERPLLYYVAKLLGDQNLAFDVLQEVWLRAFRQIRRLSQPASVRAWLYRMAHGLAVDRLRQDLSRRRVEQAKAESTDEAGDSPDFGPDDVAAVHRALDELELAHREVLVLQFLEDMSIAEIASVLDCPPGTIKSRLHYAKRALRGVLDRGGYGTH